MNADPSIRLMVEGSKVVESSELPGTLGAVALRELAAHQITRYEQVVMLTEKELLAFHGIGPKAIRILGEELRARGLSFRVG